MAVAVALQAFVGVIDLNLQGCGDSTLTDWSQMDYAVLVLVDQTDNVLDTSYTYDVEQADTGVEGLTASGKLTVLE